MSMLGVASELDSSQMELDASTFAPKPQCNYLNDCVHDWREVLECLQSFKCGIKSCQCWRWNWVFFRFCLLSLKLLFQTVSTFRFPFLFWKQKTSACHDVFGRNIGAYFYRSLADWFVRCDARKQQLSFFSFFLIHGLCWKRSTSVAQLAKRFALKHCSVFTKHATKTRKNDHLS